jgi:hypothetical protein
MNMKAPLFEQNLAIFIEALTLSESWVLSHEPQSTPIQTNSIQILTLSEYRA